MTVVLVYINGVQIRKNYQNLADHQKPFNSESPGKFILNNFEPKKILGVSRDTVSDEFVSSFEEIMYYALTFIIECCCKIF